MSKVAIISLAWILTLNSLFGFVPSALGSWSAGIDLQRFTIQKDGRLGPSFLNQTQAGWFQQASGDPVYGVYFGFFTILSGAVDLKQSLQILQLLPPSLILLAATSLAAARQFEYIGRQGFRRITPFLPLLFLLPIGRMHVMILGYAGNALASAIVMLLLWLLLRVSFVPQGSSRIVAIVILLTFVLVYTYHTWSTYFAIFAAVVFLWNGLFRHLRKRPTIRVSRLLIFAPVAWLFAAFYGANQALLSRFVDAVTVLRTASPIERPIGLYLRGAGGPLENYLRVVPILSVAHAPTLAALAVFVVLVTGSTLILVAPKEKRRSSRIGDYGLSMAIGSAATVPALFALGGVDLALSRGFEFLSVTGPFVIASALVSVTHQSRPLLERSTKTDLTISRNRSGNFLTVLVSAFLVLSVLASALDVYELSHDELLSSAEASAVSTLSERTSVQTKIWSDHRIAAAFLDHQPKAFLTFDVAYERDLEARAVLAVFYNPNCEIAAQYLKGTGAQIAITTEYMRTQGVVQRTGPLVPAPEAFACFDRSASRVYSNGAVVAYDLNSMFALYATGA